MEDLHEDLVGLVRDVAPRLRATAEPTGEEPHAPLEIQFEEAAVTAPPSLAEAADRRHDRGGRGRSKRRFRIARCEQLLGLALIHAADGELAEAVKIAEKIAGTAGHDPRLARLQAYLDEERGRRAAVALLASARDQLALGQPRRGQSPGRRRAPGRSRIRDGARDRRAALTLGRSAKVLVRKHIIASWRCVCASPTSFPSPSSPCSSSRRGFGQSLGRSRRQREGPPESPGGIAQEAGEDVLRLRPQQRQGNERELPQRLRRHGIHRRRRRQGRGRHRGEEGKDRRREVRGGLGGLAQEPRRRQQGRRHLS